MWHVLVSASGVYFADPFHGSAVIKGRGRQGMMDGWLVGWGGWVDEEGESECENESDG
jgi:hypothetical protein